MYGGMGLLSLNIPCPVITATVHRIVDPKHMEGLPEAQRRNQASGLIQCYPEVQKRHLSVYEEFAGVAQ